MVSWYRNDYPCWLMLAAKGCCSGLLLSLSFWRGRMLNGKAWRRRSPGCVSKLSLCFSLVIQLMSFSL
jgi:hypothetical protein